MPNIPRRPCLKCGEPTRNRPAYCGECGPSMRHQRDSARPSAALRGYDRKWRSYRLRYLAKNPLCAECMRQNGRATEATVVDHIVPHKGDVKLFWDFKNHQPLCRAHHDRKTARGE